MTCKFKKSDVKKAVKGSGGIISSVAIKLKCDWVTAKKYVDKFGLDDDIKAEKESLLDLAETKLLTNIKEGDNSSIFFYLKCQGKQRGYIERQEHDFTGKVTSRTIIVEDQETANNLNKLDDKFNNESDGGT